MRATLNAIDNDHSAIDSTKSSSDHRGKLLMRTWYMLSETILFMMAPNSITEIVWHGVAQTTARNHFIWVHT